VKTISLKKVAVVAVASLGFGLLSVVPANSATITGTITSINLKTVTSAPTAGSAVAVNFGLVKPAQTVANGDQIQFQAALTSVPSGGSTSVTSSISLGGTGSATYPDGWSGTAAVVTAGGVGGNVKLTASAQAITNTSAPGGTVTATATAGSGSFSFTPPVAGTYVMTVWHDTGSSPNLTLDATEVSQTVSITVAAAASTAYSNTLSTAYAIDGDGTAAGTSNTDVQPVIGTKAVANAPVGSIAIALKNAQGAASGGALTNTLNASVSGSGFIKWAATGTSTPSATGCTSATERSADLTATSAANTLYICGDSTSGTATITIRVTDADGAAYVLKKQTVTFFGSVAKLTATTTYSIGKAGGGTVGVKTAARTASTVIPAVVIKATDADGYPVTGLTIQAVSDSAAVVNTDLSSACNADTPNDAADANLYSSGGQGFYNCEIVTPTSAASGNKANLTFRVADPLSSTGGYLTAVVPVTIGGSVKTTTLTLNKSAYVAGEGIVYTITGVDSSGNPAWDGSSAVGDTATSNKPLSGTYPSTARKLVAGKYVSSSTAPSLFAPATPGSFTITVLDGAGASYVSATATVTDPNAALLTQIDALNAKVVALNALIAKIMKKLGVK